MSHVMIRMTIICLLFNTGGSWAKTNIAPHGQTGEAEVRRAAQLAFDQLRSGDYAALYEALPLASRRRIPREQFISLLARSRNTYELDRLELGQIGVAGDAAAIDTTIYGRVREPVQGEVRIEVRQYLMREAGRWRVVTDDRAGVRSLLAKHPALARRFPMQQPSVFVKRDGRWMKLTPPTRRRGK